MKKIALILSVLALCACAGGGRAGCSRKDFYSAKIKDIKKGCE